MAGVKVEAVRGRRFNQQQYNVGKREVNGGPWQFSGELGRGVCRTTGRKRVEREGEATRYVLVPLSPALASELSASAKLLLPGRPPPRLGLWILDRCRAAGAQGAAAPIAAARRDCKRRGAPWFPLATALPHVALPRARTPGGKDLRSSSAPPTAGAGSRPQLLAMSSRRICPFRVGQIIEALTHQEGYRGGWFRSKVVDIEVEDDGEVALQIQYLDFPGEGLEWIRLYQAIPGMPNTRNFLMCRPLPLMQALGVVCSEIPWKRGDKAEWLQDDIWWKVTVVGTTDDGRVQVRQAAAPLGEDKPWEQNFARPEDLRPALRWTLENGWALYYPWARPAGTLHARTPQHPQDGEGSAYAAGLSTFYRRVPC